MLFKKTISTLQKRFNSSLLPPQVASLKEIGKLSSNYPQAHPVLFKKMKYFYQTIPKGAAPVLKRTTFWGRYYQKYFERDTLMPIVHFVGVLLPVGYYLTYFKGGHCKHFSFYYDYQLLD